MLSTIKNLSEISFSRKPMVLKVQAKDAAGVPYGEVGVGALFSIDSSMGFTLLDNILIELELADSTVISVLFEADDSPYLITQFLDYVSFGGGTVQDYYNHVAGVIQSHYLLSAFLIVEAIDSSPNFDLKFSGINTTDIASFQISFQTQATASVVQTPYLSSQLPVNHAVVLEVYLESTYKSGDWHRIVKVLHRAPERDSIYSFDVAEAIHGTLLSWLSEIPLPEFNKVESYIAPNVRRFYMKIGEQEGAPIVQQPWEVTAISRVWRGGNSMESTTDFFASLDFNTSILTYYKNKVIDNKQPEWLLWLNWWDVPALVCLEVKQYDIEGVVIANTIVGGTPANFTALVDARDCLLLPAGATQLGVLPSCVKYKVRVIDKELYMSSGPAQTKTAVSLWQTYYIADSYSEDTRYLQYINSFGGFETLRCTGKWSFDIEIQRNKSVSFGENESYYGVETQTDEVFERIYTYRTGFISASEMKILEELLVSGMAWDVSERYVFPLIMVSNKFQIYETWRELNAYEIQFKLRRTERNYKHDALIQSSFGGWYNPSQGGFWTDYLGKIWSTP